MKKTVKILSLILCLLTLSSLLCSCNFLDEKREKHIIYENDERTEVMLNGKKYKLLPGFDDELIFLSETAYTYDCFMTASDVPVLLASFFGERVSISEDKNFIHGGWSVSEADGREYRTDYCEESIYDKVVHDLNSISEYRLAIRYNGFGENGRYEAKFAYMDENANKLIEETLNNDNNAVNDGLELFDAVDLVFVSENEYFLKKAMEVYSAENEQGETGYYIMFVSKGENVFYKVSNEELIKNFDEVFAKSQRGYSYDAIEEPAFFTEF